MSCGCGKDNGCMSTLERSAQKPASSMDAGRRDFLRGAGAFAVTTLAPGVTLYSYGTGSAEAKPADQPVSSNNRWGMLIDVGKCPDGCTECVTACATEHGLKDTGHPATDAQWIRKVDVANPDTGSKLSIPVMCQHCDEPPCVDVCPTGASFKRADGIVLVDKHICIGCRYCMMACPYQARSFIHEPLTDQMPHAPRGKGTVESCTMCVHRVDAGEKPACVEACSLKAGGAMMFGDLNDPSSEIAQRVKTYATTQIRDDLGTNPGVRYQNI